MKISYQVEGRKRVLLFKDARWSGKDAMLVSALNANPHGFIGHHEYYPTAWHLAKAVADALGGKLDEPEPDFETGEQDGKAFGPARKG
jgi:hypothetical protein